MFNNFRRVSLQVEVSDFEKICNQGNSIIFSFNLMDQFSAISNSNKRSASLEDIKEFSAKKENEEVQFKTLAFKRRKEERIAKIHQQQASVCATKKQQIWEYQQCHSQPCRPLVKSCQRHSP